MAQITLEQFNGLAPKVQPRNLDVTLAQVAVDVRFDRANLSPMKGTTPIGESVPAGSTHLYLYEDTTWLAWDRRVNVVRSPISGDSRQRIFISDESTYPSVYSQGQEFRLGIPSPDSTPSAAGDGGSGDPALDESISYTFTFVDAWGLEGAPGSAIAPFTRTIDSDVTLTNLPQAPTGTYNFGVGAVLRIYRSNQGTSDADFQFVADVPLGTTTYVDSIPNGNLGEVIPSIDWIEPPNDDLTLYPDGPLRGLVALSDGVLAGYSGNTLAFSEPFVPHAWPLSYRQSIPEQIRGIAPLTQGALVVTDGRPYMLFGSDPQSYSLSVLDIDQACASEESLVSLGEVAIYASPDGLVVSNGTAINLVTEPLFAKDDWQAYMPETVRGYQREGRYVGVYTVAGQERTFVFDPRGSRDAFVESTVVVDGGWYSIEDDELYVLVGADIHTFETGADLSLQWKSKKFVLPHAHSMSAARVIMDGDITMNIYDKGQLEFTKQLVPGRRVQRIPDFYGEELEIEFIGTGHVEYAMLSESMELASEY